MRGNHWNAWEKYAADGDAGRTRGYRCWRAWVDVLPMESIDESGAQERMHWRAWERFLSIADLGAELSSIEIETPVLPEKALT